MLTGETFYVIYTGTYLTAASLDVLVLSSIEADVVAFRVFN